MYELAHTRTLVIDTLDLAGNNLGSDAIRALVTASTPLLQRLKLSENNLDAAAAHWLSRGEWRNLQCLNLDDNLLDNVAMQHLAQGQWEYLQCLSVCSNDIDNDGLERLTKGCWPNLCCVMLDIRLGNAAAWGVLDLDPDCLPEFYAKAAAQLCSMRVSRLKQSPQKFWQVPPEPPLQVCFHHCPTSRLAAGIRLQCIYSVPYRW